MAFLDQLFDSAERPRTELESLRKRAKRAYQWRAAKSSEAANRIDHLESQVAEMGLIVRALYLALKAQPGFDAEAFQRIVDRLDALDGAKDGRSGRAARSGGERK
jgi:hypothetical protein